MKNPKKLWRCWSEEPNKDRGKENLKKYLDFLKMKKTLLAGRCFKNCWEALVAN